MVLRAKLLQAATAALYMGPLLAGLSGFGWAMLAPFMSVFLLWLMILRPHQWPQSHREWLRARTWVSVLSQVLSQLLLIAVLFGIGRGIGGVMGFVPLFHPALPVAVSFMAIPMTRLFWDSEKALAQGLTIDELLYPQRDSSRALPRMAGRAPGHSPEDAIAPLLAFPADSPLHEVGPILDDVLDDAEAWARLAALGTALEAGTGQHAVLREALVLWATDPDRIVANCAPGALRVAFRAAGQDPQLLSRLLPRASALAHALPQRHGQFPDRSALDVLKAGGLTGQLASDLDALLSALGHLPAKASTGSKRAPLPAAGSASMA
jgi:uncharacterized membrane protein